MTCEESVHKADAVSDEKTEANAEQAGGRRQPTIKPNEAPSRVRAWNRDCSGDQHHAGDGAHPENEKINDAEGGIVDGGKHEKSDGSRACQTVYDAHHQRP